MDSYRQLAAALAGDGIRCYFQTAGQMVVSAQEGPVWPDRGNSFWVTRTTSRWHLFTWASVGYRIPEGADVARLCRACMAYGSSAMPRVPAHIAGEFALIDLSDDEIDVVFAEMDKHAKPGAADVT